MDTANYPTLLQEDTTCSSELLSEETNSILCSDIKEVNDNEEENITEDLENKLIKEDIEETIDNDNPTISNQTVTSSVFSIGPFPSTSCSIDDKEKPFFGYQFANKPNDSNHSSESTMISDKTVDLSIDSSSSSFDTAKEINSNCVEDTIDARAARLKRLEEQADWLVKKMSATNLRGSMLSNRLEELHEVYGTVPTPPTLPDVLPTFRIPTESNKNVRLVFLE